MSEETNRCTAVSGCTLNAGHAGFHLIADESAEKKKLSQRVAELETERNKLADWKKHILNTVKAFPEYEPGDWAGDKEGWGYCFELINYVRRERDLMISQLETVTAARDEACAIADTAIKMQGDFIGRHDKLGSARIAELRKVGS